MLHQFNILQEEPTDVAGTPLENIGCRKIIKKPHDYSTKVHVNQCPLIPFKTIAVIPVC